MFDRELEERLVRYCRVDTQSDESSGTTPSTARQLDLLRMLADELGAMGAQDVALTDYGAVLATIPATVPHPAPTIALLAHVDTAPAYNAAGVKPIVHRDYKGQDIVLPEGDQVLSPAAFPYLAGKIGHDIITSSGSTLLGADDKAGVAIIMTLANHLLRNPSIAHGTIRVAFTPDEEIGRGVDQRLPADLRAPFAYTLDGAEVGEVVYETFSADRAVVSIEGVSIHPGDAKGKLVNALHLAAKIINALPHVTRTPETTEGREGVHSPLPDERHGRGGGAELHPARLRAGGARVPRRASEAGVRGGAGHRAAGEDRLHDHAAVPQHALLAGEGHAAGGAGAACLPRAGDRAGLDSHPRRDGRLAPDGDGRADAQSLHGDAEHPRPTGVDQRAGHGALGADVPAAGGAVGRRESVTFRRALRPHAPAWRE
jgi:hypothetical protein